LRPSFGFAGDDGTGNGDGDEGAGDLWDPDAARHGAGQNGAGRKEWNLLVVNDQKVVNAMATPGMCAGSNLPYRTPVRKTSEQVQSSFSRVSSPLRGTNKALLQYSATVGPQLGLCIDREGSPDGRLEIGHVGKQVSRDERAMCLGAQSPDLCSCTPCGGTLLLRQDLHRPRMAGGSHRPPVWPWRGHDHFTYGPSPLANTGVRGFVPSCLPKGAGVVTNVDHLP
jgi:hypothetical protein